MTLKFSGENAYKHLHFFSKEIGPRHMGTSQEKRCADYIESHFRSLGLAPVRQPFESYSFDDASAELIRPNGERVECSPIAMTASTPKEGITKDVVYLDSPNPLLLDETIADKIVIVHGDFYGDDEKTFHSFNPAALVSIDAVVHTHHYLKIKKTPATRANGTIPSVNLSLKEGMKLLRDLPETLTLISITENPGKKESVNIYADLKGSSTSDETIVMSAHFDSVWGCPAAYDNGGGISTMLEFARVYVEKGSRYNIRFLAVSGEEMGLCGAKAYVRGLKDEHDALKKDPEFALDGLKTPLEKTRFLINIDLIGPLYGITSALTLGDPDIAASVRFLANQERYPMRIKEAFIYSSDNMAFNKAGVPSISFNRCPFEDVGGHSPGDVIENCSIEGIQHVSDFIEKWIDTYVMSLYLFPFNRKLSAKAQKIVNERFDDTFLENETFGPEKRYKATD